MKNYILYDNYGITTINDGFSLGDYKSNNMSFNTEEDHKVIVKNREQLAKQLGFTLNDFVTSEQTHSANFVRVDTAHKGMGAYSLDNAILNNDAMYTFENGIVLATYHADCVPIYFKSPKHNLIGIIHAGWVGTSKSITKKTLKHVIDTYNINPADIIVHIGPSISQENYEVGIDVFEKLKAYESAFKKRGTSLYVDISYINHIQVSSLGIKNISVDSRCTYENKDIFYSHRRNNKTGRMLAFIYQ